MTGRLPDERDLHSSDAKARAALERFRLEAVRSPVGRDFEEAWDALTAEFASRGELERREVVTTWLTGPSSYHLLIARDRDGQLAGARDCHVIVDRVRSIAVVYLAHTIIVPACRRSGLGALLRAAPLTLAKRSLSETGLDPEGTEVLLAAEMEPVDVAAPETVTRLVAYGREGFAAISPSHLPYLQPDFRDIAELEARGEGPARPLPLLAVVRWIGHEGAGRLPHALAEAFVNQLYEVFATHCRPEDLRGPREHALGALRASGAEWVPLLPLPARLDDASALAPLTRAAVLVHHTGPNATTARLG